MSPSTTVTVSSFGGSFTSHEIQYQPQEGDKIFHDDCLDLFKKKLVKSKNNIP